MEPIICAYFYGLSTLSWTKKKSFWCSFEAEHHAKSRQTFHLPLCWCLPSSLLKHGDSGMCLAYESSLLQSGLQTDHGCLCGECQQGTCPCPKLWNSFLHLSLLQAWIPISLWSRQKLGWAVFTRGQQHQGEQLLPAPVTIKTWGRLLFQKPKGRCFSLF